MLKDEIHKLRNENKSYREIAQRLNCAISTVSYHLDVDQQRKTRIRTRKSRKLNPLHKKLSAFLEKNCKSNNKLPQTSTASHLLKLKTESFVKLHGKYMKPNFTGKDVIRRAGINPVCYLTGDAIDINNPRTYHFDHIIPRSKGGDNSLDNLGLCTKEANQSKHDLTIAQYIELCKKVLENNGYKVEQLSSKS